MAQAPHPYVRALAMRLRNQGNGSISAAAAGAVGAGKPLGAGANGGKKSGGGIFGSGGGAGQGGQKGGSGGGQKYDPMKVLEGLGTGSLLSPKQLQAAATALSVLETRPEIHGYKETAKQLGESRDSAAAGLAKLGTRTAGNVSSVYQNIAKSEADSLASQAALSGQANANAASLASNSAAELNGMQSGALGDYEKQLASRGAPAGGGAQEALAQAVAAQNAAQSADAGAAQQFTNSQGAGSNALLAAMAGSTQMQGGESIGHIGRQTVNRIGESNAGFNQNIQAALGKVAEAKASRGSKAVKDLLELRQGEQKFKLGEQAVQGEKAKLSSEEKQNQAENAINQQKANASSKSALAKYLQAQTAQYEAQHPGATSGELRKLQREHHEDVQEVKTLIPTVLAEAGGAPLMKPAEINQFLGRLITKTEASPALVQKVMQNWLQERNAKSNEKLSRDPNGAALGR